MQYLGSEAIDQITKTLPHHHLDERIRHEIAVRGLDVADFDVREWMWKLYGRCIWESA
jgi:hypothetical protein